MVYLPMTEADTILTFRAVIPYPRSLLKALCQLQSLELPSLYEMLPKKIFPNILLCQCVYYRRSWGSMAAGSIKLWNVSPILKRCRTSPVLVNMSPPPQRVYLYTVASQDLRWQQFTVPEANFCHYLSFYNSSPCFRELQLNIHSANFLSSHPLSPWLKNKWTTWPGQETQSLSTNQSTPSSPELPISWRPKRERRAQPAPGERAGSTLFLQWDGKGLF